MQRHYSRAPIKEAIIDLRVTLPEGFFLEKLREIYPCISSNFPTIEPFYQGIGAITYRPGSSFQVDTRRNKLVSGLEVRTICKPFRPLWKDLHSTGLPLIIPGKNSVPMPETYGKSIKKSVSQYA